MFEQIKAAPPDAILGLTEAFRADKNPDKVNLGVGVFKDDTGNTPVLAVVHAAEQRLLDEEGTKSYLPIDGSADYATRVQRLVFGETHPFLSARRAATAQTPGGTAALRIIGDFLHQHQPDSRLWLSAPTWANHPAIMSAAGVKTASYAYYDPKTFSLDFDAMKKAISKLPAGDVVLLHACCHNPSGVDPSPAQWKELAGILAERRVLPLLDFAYQGFANGVSEDRVGVLEIAKACKELVVCSSFSKNFSIYRERVGAITVVAGDQAAAAAVHSNIKKVIRRNYSNPPAHGGQVVSTVLGDELLREKWEVELAAMRERINGMRGLFKDRLDAAGVQLSASGNDFITAQRGMFSFSGLNREQVEMLRSDFSIYAVGSGRINVAGITAHNVDYVVGAIGKVLSAGGPAEV